MLRFEEGQYSMKEKEAILANKSARKQCLCDPSSLVDHGRREDHFTDE